MRKKHLWIDCLLACYSEWVDYVTLGILTVRLPQVTLPPSEITPPINSGSSTPIETPAPNIASSPPTETPYPDIASLPLGSTHSNTTSTLSPQRKTPFPDIALS